MGEKIALTCRGCLAQVNGKNSYSFLSINIKDIFTECTAIQILPEEDDCFPQQLCSPCYDKCKDWRSFKETCQKVDKHLQSKAIAAFALQMDEEEPTIRIKEEIMDIEDPSDVESFIIGDVFKQEEEAEDEKIRKEPIENKDDGEQCPVCELLLAPSDLLKDHLKEHYSEKNPNCPICDEHFTRSSKIYSHIMSKHKRRDEEHHSETPQTREMKVCPVCEEQTDQLFEHLTTVHLKPGQVKCPVCNASVSYLKRHLLVHAGGRLPCGFCESSFADSRNRLCHWKKQHGDQEFPQKTIQVVQPKKVQVECPKCPKTFRNHSELLNHFVMHTNERPYKCNYCTFANRYKAKVKIHINESHPKKSAEEGVSVEEGSIFRNARPWEAMGYTAVTRRHSEASQAHVCKVCAKGFTTKTRLQRHSVVHTEEKPFHCLYCAKEYRRKDHGIVHVKRCHPEKPLANGVVLKKSSKYAKENTQAGNK